MVNFLISILFLQNFINYIIYIIPIVIKWIYLSIKKKTIKPILKRPEYNYDFAYINVLTILCLILIYSTTFPVILFLGFFYFLFSFFFERLLLIHLFKRYIY
jgi:hypothetical protein